MVYNALIVDDEPMIRFGLASCVDWEKEGVRLAGEASNGEAALRLIKNEDIHILVTDIKMPLMDGLELIRLAKEVRPLLKVVLVSSYSDFSYAVEAVKLGVVVDYLLKPTMEPEDLIRVIRACKERLELDKASSRKEEWLRLEEAKSRRLRFEEELKAFMGGADQAFEWKPDWAIGNLALAVWKLDADDGKSLRQLVSLEAAKNRLDEWCGNGLSFVAGDDELVTLIADYNGSALTDIALFHKRLGAEGSGLRFTVGISPVIHRLQAAALAYVWALKALENAFFEGRNRCYLGRIPASAGEGTDREELEAEDGIDRLRERFSKAYAFADQYGSEAALNDMIALWRMKRYGRSEIIAHGRSLLTMMWSHRFRMKTEEDMGMMIGKLEGLKQAPSLDHLIRTVREELSRFWKPDDSPVAVDAGGAHVIQLALSYIQEHYRGDISLQDVADYVHMSKNYFSEQFKQRTGMNFIDFVIRLRLHYAKHLLEHTSMKVIDVGADSGFNSPKHFLKLFKREMNCTPVEFRERFERQRAADDGRAGEDVLYEI
ncbi:response regulator [Paenibacillus sp. LHD-117]|uniref:helix-turn-helix domain-containing protein n=1 Tax=Paenibacillus sp. LHD-117 TaxID=3071412 RepID=UPI0027E0E19D|nr:helix-turn-helix domain-containing protein [Paenibacillus sp. LHD-117]MDQ6423128.1 response regulator [Paenibacillus sp. LHD-117]